jgi:hypothetical protein
MKRLLILLLILIPGLGFAQQFPDVFAGTWCDSISGIYETWEKAGDKHLKGYSYEMKDGEKQISEYIDLSMRGNDLVYTVSVKNQNNEEPVSFTLSATDSVYTFVNSTHDFPTYIRYLVISPNEVKAIVGNKNRSFTLNYRRID